MHPDATHVQSFIFFFNRDMLPPNKKYAPKTYELEQARVNSVKLKQDLANTSIHLGAQEKQKDASI